MATLHESYFKCNQFINHHDKKVRIAAYELLIATLIDFVYACEKEFLMAKIALNKFPINGDEIVKSKLKVDKYQKEIAHITAKSQLEQARGELKALKPKGKKQTTPKKSKRANPIKDSLRIAWIDAREYLRQNLIERMSNKLQKVVNQMKIIGYVQLIKDAKDKPSKPTLQIQQDDEHNAATKNEPSKPVLQIQQDDEHNAAAKKDEPSKPVLKIQQDDEHNASTKDTLPKPAQQTPLKVVKEKLKVARDKKRRLLETSKFLAFVYSWLTIEFSEQLGIVYDLELQLFRWIKNCGAGYRKNELALKLAIYDQFRQMWPDDITFEFNQCNYKFEIDSDGYAVLCLVHRTGEEYTVFIALLELQGGRWLLPHRIFSQCSTIEEVSSVFNRWFGLAKRVAN
jgi:hypothetical protein